MFLRFFSIIALVSMHSYADINNENLISIVKVTKAKVRSQAVPNDKYIVDYYKLGDVIYLDYCDKFDWCKIRGQELYISKATIGVMSYKPSDIAKLDTVISTKKELKCIKLNKIHFDENELFTYEEQQKLLEHHIGSCIDMKLLKDILNEVSQYYTSKGYITTKPYLGEQNIRDGELDIKVTKGFIQEIINKETNSTDGRIATAFMFQTGEQLNLRDLETSLEMMNRVPSYSSKFQILPASELGGSTVLITTEKTLPYRLSVGAIGERQGYDDNPYLNVDFSVDNLFNINDILTLRYNGSRVQSYYQSSSGSELDYSFALSNYLISYTLFQFQYSQAVIGLNDTYRSNGDTVGSTIKVSTVLHRNQRNKVELAASLQHKDNKNYFSNQLIDVSSYKTTLAQLDLSDSYYANWGQLHSVLSYYKGTNLLGARDDSSLDVDEKLQFTKFSLDMDLIYNLPVVNNCQFNSHAHLQYTDDFLYDNNKLRIGSYYTVRGYEASYYGNSGYYIRNDITKYFYPNINQYFLKTVSPFVGLDFGAVECQNNTVNACGSLVGGSLGLKTAGNNVNTELALSRGLQRSDAREFQNLFRYQVTFKY